MDYKMRIPTSKEYDQLLKLTGGDDAKMHWTEMYSHVMNTDADGEIGADLCVIRGCPAANFWDTVARVARRKNLGFRPVVENLDHDTPSPEVKEGDVIILGTLYMNGVPVRCPQKPTCGGDITDYIPGAKLEMKEPLKDPSYWVTGIYLGNGTAVADRNFLRCISAADLETALPTDKNAVDDSDEQMKRFCREQLSAICLNAGFSEGMGYALLEKYLRCTSPLMPQEAVGAIEDIVNNAFDPDNPLGKEPDQLLEMDDDDFIAAVVNAAIRSFRDSVESWQQEMKDKAPKKLRLKSDPSVVLTIVEDKLYMRVHDNTKKHFFTVRWKDFPGTFLVDAEDVEYANFLQGFQL